MNYTIDEVGAARLFMLVRGRGGEFEYDDVRALVELLRQFSLSGVKVGLEKSKQLFRNSSNSSGSCRVLSQGDQCTCFLCLVDRELNT